MKIFRLLLVLVLNALSTMPGHTAPLLDRRNNWNQNIFASITKTTCSPDGQCWERLSISERSDNSSNISEDVVDTLRLQSRRQIARPVSDFTLESWKDSMLEETEQQIQSSSLTNKQIPTRITKKDVFVSRSWGAGGMPFSVLYMNSHGPRSNHAITSTPIQQSVRTTENPISSLEHPNDRVALRNGQSTVQPRRQYSIIPQLFISYGWGSFGK